MYHPRQVIRGRWWPRRQPRRPRRARRRGHVVLPADNKDLTGRDVRGHNDLRVRPDGDRRRSTEIDGGVRSDVRASIQATRRDSSVPAVAGLRRPIPRESGRDSDRDRGRLSTGDCARCSSRDARCDARHDARPDENEAPLLPKPHGWPPDVRYRRLAVCVRVRCGRPEAF